MTLSVTQPAEDKLIQEYERIRQREYELISDLLDFLPKIDNLEESRVHQVRDALFHADHPLMIAFVGPFSSGKSSLINALLGSEVLKTGVTPTTDRICIIRHGEANRALESASDVVTLFHPSPLLQSLSLVDTPGLESVFRQHEETTKRFLHRADVVILTMLATQAMTASNVQTLQIFKEYGKKVILVINQADLLDESERATVKQYVLDQTRDKLGFSPEIWLVSAKQGMQAHQGETLDADLWQSSGMAQFERYIANQWSDSERLRQKLQTPLRIVQNAHQAALSAVKHNQSTFDQYRNIQDNLDAQMQVQKDELRKAVRDAHTEIDAAFHNTAQRTEVALSEAFQFSRAFAALRGGIAELFGIARLFRTQRSTLTQNLLQQHKVYEPLDGLPKVLDKLAPRLEAQDMQDLDQLVKYGQREASQLPPSLQAKLIGSIQAPTSYDRSALNNVRPSLNKLEAQARQTTQTHIDEARRGALIFLAAWQLIIAILFISIFILRDVIGSEGGFPVLGGLALLLVASALGFAALPLRGRWLAVQITQRLHQVQAEYKQTLSQAADAQIEYGIQVRREALNPLTRLVQAQRSLHADQFSRLQTSEQHMNQLEADLNALGKRKILGFAV